MIELDLSADKLVSALVQMSEHETVCILDSCGVGHLGSHLLVAGIEPVKVVEFADDDPDEILRTLDELSQDKAAIFTLSYEFGAKIIGIQVHHASAEPDVFLAIFDSLIFHDYDSGKTFLAGSGTHCELISKRLSEDRRSIGNIGKDPDVLANFTRAEYISAIETIKERIRSGDTYQTNLTQQMTCEVPGAATAGDIFLKLRRDHPAPFAAFLRRENSAVVSASPERFFRTTSAGEIESSPIKGTRPRGDSPAADEALRRELQNSLKDRAENTMIVDLIRNDLGRVCEFGTVVVEKLCDVEEHPTLFHLVSTIRGTLRKDTKFSDILRAMFPCGSITGAPKMSTMRIIDELEPDARGLSMGSIGIRFPRGWGIESLTGNTDLDLSVAIRTMVVRDRRVTFNVGGGIVIDSDASDEYEESLLKARALLRALATSDHR